MFGHQIDSKVFLGWATVLVLMTRQKHVIKRLNYVATPQTDTKSHSNLDDIQ